MSTALLSPSPAAQSRARVLVWFAGLLAAFLTIRATTTLVAGASFEAPGDGWRSVWQLLVVAVLVAGLLRRKALAGCVALVAANYLGASLLELATPDALLGVVPVDMRDRIVHPLVALLGAAAVVVSAATGGRVHAD